MKEGGERRMQVLVVTPSSLTSLSTVFPFASSTVHRRGRGRPRSGVERSLLESQLETSKAINRGVTEDCIGSSCSHAFDEGLRMCA